MTLFAFVRRAAVLGILVFSGAAAFAETADQALFTAVSPDVLIVLDLSDSMRRNPKGEADGLGEPLRRFGNEACSGETFHDTPRPGFATDCARYLVARRVLYDLFDNNRDGVIDRRDEAGLGVRLGFWAFSAGIRRLRDIGQPFAQNHAAS